MKLQRTALPLDRSYGGSLGVLAGATVVGIAARIEIPFVPVPLTLLTFGAMGVGLALGPRRGAVAVGLTLLAGACGAPVFSGGASGVAHLFGPTGGYLWALPLLAAGYGLAARRLWIAPLVSLAHLLLGAVWLALFLGPVRALAVGFTPFLLGEAVKMAVALGAARLLRRAD